MQYANCIYYQHPNFTSRRVSFYFFLPKVKDKQITDRIVVVEGGVEEERERRGGKGIGKGRGGNGKKNYCFCCCCCCCCCC